MEKESVKLNSFRPFLKRSHGGHVSTLPSGSSKLLISFSYSNDFFFIPFLPSFSLLPQLPPCPLFGKSRSLHFLKCKHFLGLRQSWYAEIVFCLEPF